MFVPERARNIAIETGNNKLDRFIWTMWSTLRSWNLELQPLGLASSNVDRMLGESNFQNNVNTVIQGVMPSVRSFIENGRFSVADLLSLPKVSANDPGEGSMIYLRLYTHQDPAHADPENVAIYIGQSVSGWKRHV
jgi:hypothetical protein